MFLENLAATGLNFTDLQFIFRFLPLYLLLYYLFPGKIRSWITVIFSLVFYAVNAKEYTAVLLLVLILNFAFSFGIAKKKKGVLILSFITDAGFLMSFKILSVLGLTVSLPADYNLRILLPLGISFYTFKIISYQVDLYRGKYERASLGDFLAYAADFSQIISGPIGRYDLWKKDHDHLISIKKFKNKVTFAMNAVCDGLTFFIAGLFIKIILANHLAILWNSIGTIGYDSISTPLAWIGVVVYSLNLFYDFWGYSLIAAGIGVMTGHSFIRNFKDPYGALSVSDFYRRWHITLGNWFKDYIYFPLGGSRCSKINTARNLIIVWVLTGIWHGITLNYLLWAGILLLLILSEKFVLSHNKVVLRIFGQLHVLVLIPLTWIIFALDKPMDLYHYFARLFGVMLPTTVINAKDFLTTLQDGWFYLLISIVCLIPGIRDSFYHDRHSVFWTVLLFILFWFCIYSSSGSDLNPFMYMSF